MLCYVVKKGKDIGIKWKDPHARVTLGSVGKPCDGLTCLKEQLREQCTKSVGEDNWVFRGHWLGVERTGCMNGNTRSTAKAVSWLQRRQSFL